ncbi:MAG: recombinase family protein [Lachnospiraceae bacterium]
MPEHRNMGYARVSSVGQNFDRQIMELKRYVPEDCIVVDKVSGKNLERPGYQALKGPLGLRSGDILYVKSLDRLSRTKADIKSELIWFKENGITLRILDLPTTLLNLEQGQEWIQDMVNNILIEVMASLAEQERVMIRQRQREGIDVARKKGKHMGRPKNELPENWDVVYGMWIRKEVTGRCHNENLHTFSIYGRQSY